MHIRFKIDLSFTYILIILLSIGTISCKESNSPNPDTNSENSSSNNTNDSTVNSLENGTDASGVNSIPTHTLSFQLPISTIIARSDILPEPVQWPPFSNLLNRSDMVMIKSSVLQRSDISPNISAISDEFTKAGDSFVLATFESESDLEGIESYAVPDIQATAIDANFSEYSSSGTLSNGSLNFELSAPATELQMFIAIQQNSSESAIFKLDENSQISPKAYLVSSIAPTYAAILLENDKNIGTITSLGKLSEENSKKLPEISLESSLNEIFSNELLSDYISINSDTNANGIGDNLEINGYWLFVHDVSNQKVSVSSNGTIGVSFTRVMPVGTFDYFFTIKDEDYEVPNILEFINFLYPSIEDLFYAESEFSYRYDIIDFQLINDQVAFAYSKVKSSKEIGPYGHYEFYSALISNEFKNVQPSEFSLFYSTEYLNSSIQEELNGESFPNVFHDMKFNWLLNSTSETTSATWTFINNEENLDFYISDINQNNNLALKEGVVNALTFPSIYEDSIDSSSSINSSGNKLIFVQETPSYVITIIDNIQETQSLNDIVEEAMASIENDNYIFGGAVMPMGKILEDDSVFLVWVGIEDKYENNQVSNHGTYNLRSMHGTKNGPEWSWSTPVLIEEDISLDSINNTGNVHMESNSSNDAILIWSAEDESGDINLAYCFYSDGSWTMSDFLSFDPTKYELESIALENTGKAILLFHNKSNENYQRHIYKVELQENVPLNQSPEKISLDWGYAYSLDITTNDSGKVVISWIQYLDKYENDHVVILEKEDATWKDPIIFK